MRLIWNTEGPSISFWVLLWHWLFSLVHWNFDGTKKAVIWTKRFSMNLPKTWK